MAEMSDNELGRRSDQQKRWARASLANSLKQAEKLSACDTSSICYYKTGVAEEVYPTITKPKSEYTYLECIALKMQRRCAMCGRNV